ncbi:M14 family zinc carboxypeptidase [Streptomyces sp. NPDC050085]|uniref:M14 family zinc carboxypeptidase n=1 Tax=Streptomyces sp. NPDC050085 TaxID=3365600 RepID=UPI0037A22BE7
MRATRPHAEASAGQERGRPGTRWPAWAALRADLAVLAHRRPAVCRMTELGRSREGRPLELLSIDGGPHALLVVGGVHANEVVSAATLQVLVRRVLDEPELRHQWSWHFVSCIDPDGAVLNEGWSHTGRPPELSAYHRGFFRPALNEQPEWSLPGDDTGATTAEGTALMKAIDLTRPALMAALHCRDSQGTYLTASTAVDGLDTLLADAAARHGLSVDPHPCDGIGAPAAGRGVVLLPPPDIPRSPDTVPRGRGSAAHASRYGTLSVYPEVPMWHSRPLALGAEDGADHLDQASARLGTLWQTVRAQGPDTVFTTAITDTLTIMDRMAPLLRQHPQEGNQQDLALLVPLRATGMLLRHLDTLLACSPGRPRGLADQRDAVSDEFERRARAAAAALTPRPQSVAALTGFQISIILGAARLIT